MRTCPCNEYPLTPHFYIVKLGLTGVYFFFLIFALKHRLWVLVLILVRVPTIYVLSKKKKSITFCHLKIIVLTAVKNYYILHGHVFVMPLPSSVLMDDLK